MKNGGILRSWCDASCLPWAPASTKPRNSQGSAGTLRAAQPLAGAGGPGHLHTTAHATRADTGACRDEVLEPLRGERALEAPVGGKERGQIRSWRPPWLVEADSIIDTNYLEIKPTLFLPPACEPPKIWGI